MYDDSERVMGVMVAIALTIGVVGLLGFVHASATNPSAHCFAGFKHAQWPKWIGCAIAVHETLAGGLIGLAGVIFAAWLAYSGAQDQLAQVRNTANETNRLRAQERFQEAASEIDALVLAKGYLRTFVDNFPDAQHAHYATHNFLGTLADLNDKASVYLSQSVANAPRGFGRSITTVMWRLEKLAAQIGELSDRGLLVGDKRTSLENEVRSSVAGAQKLADDIDELLPSLRQRLLNLKQQCENLED
jgi:hypothetical protein